MQEEGNCSYRDVLNMPLDMQDLLMAGRKVMERAKPALERKAKRKAEMEARRKGREQ